MLFQLERPDGGNGVEMAMAASNAQYHQSCKLNYSNTHYKELEHQRVKKMIGCKYRRSRNNTENSVQKDLCFFCGQPPDNNGLHKAAIFQVDK